MTWADIPQLVIGVQKSYKILEVKKKKITLQIRKTRDEQKEK